MERRREGEGLGERLRERVGFSTWLNHKHLSGVGSSLLSTLQASGRARQFAKKE